MDPQAGRPEESAEAPEPEASGHEPVAEAIGPKTNQRETDARAIEPDANGHAPAAGTVDRKATQEQAGEPTEPAANGHGSIAGTADLEGKAPRVDARAIEPDTTGPASVSDAVDPVKGPMEAEAQEQEIDAGATKHERHGPEPAATALDSEARGQEIDAGATKPERHGPEPIATAVDSEASDREVEGEQSESEANGQESAPHPDESASNEAGGRSGDTEQASTGFVDLINEALSPRQTLPGFADPRVEHVNSIELPPWFIDRCRQAYLSVRFDPSAACRVVGVTSGSYGEGKTSVAIGTAIAMAVDTNKPTLLIECDFAEPTLYKFFGIERGRGLGEWLDGGARLRIVRGAALVPNVFVIPSGSPQSEPARFLFELVDREVMVGLRSCFGNVVIDLPPALNISYGSLAYGLADHLLIVARSGATLTADLERLVTLIGRDRVSGIVLNGIDTRTPMWLRQLL